MRKNLFPGMPLEPVYKAGVALFNADCMRV
jgi:hypothetical protein